MGKVKSALEIALEKTANIAALTQEERERAQDHEKMLAVLRDFYQGTCDSGGLWQKLKGSKPALLVEAQMNLMNTIALGMLPEDFGARKKAILAIETLKDKQNTAVIEAHLNAIESLLKEYQDMKEQAVEDLRRQLEMHPQLRMRPVRTPDGKTVMQMTVSVDEAVKARLSEFLAEQDEQFNQELSVLIATLKDSVQSG